MGNLDILYNRTTVPVYVKMKTIERGSSVVNAKKKKEYDFYKKYGILPEIILDKNNVLLDGFCSYYIAQVWNMTYVKIRRVKCQG